MKLHPATAFMLGAIFATGVCLPTISEVRERAFSSGYKSGLNIGFLRGRSAYFRKSIRQSERAIWEMCADSGKYRRADPVEAAIDERCL